MHSLPGRTDSRPRAERRQRRLLQELVVRGTVAAITLAFDQIMVLAGGTRINPVIRLLALLGLLLNVAYYFAAGTGHWLRAQAYGRMLVDVGLITVGLASVGGLAAAPYLGIYAIVVVYVGVVFSSWACVVVTAGATAAYVGVAVLQATGRLTLPAAPALPPWGPAAFNLLVLNIVGVLTAILAEAYRRSRLRLATLNRELERANDQSLILNAEIQRAAQLRVLGEVVAGVTHELGNVLSSAVGHIAQARRQPAAMDPALEEHLDQIERSFDTAVRIVRNTLHTARQPQAGRRAVAVADVARRLVELKGYDLRRDGIAVRVDFPEPFPLVLGVSFQVQQVLLNLVTNAQQALRAAPPPRLIEIVGRAVADHVVVEVLDTGPGIPAEALPRLFEPFFTTKVDGTGLGLAISAGIVRDLGGDLSAANRLERGAVFRLTFPALQVGEEGLIRERGEVPIRSRADATPS